MSEKSAYDAQGRRKYLTNAEGARFIAHACILPRSHALFCLTLFYTGCRISEALHIGRLDVDTETNELLIKTLKQRKRTKVRRVSVPEFLINGLIQISSGSRKRCIWQFSRTSAWRLVKSVMKAAHITGIPATAKGLRHGFGVRCALAQIPLTLITKWMGHSDSNTTAIYLDVRDEEERELIAKTW